MDPLRPGQNPRDVLGKHKERSYRKFEYTAETVANASGYAVSTIQSMASSARHLELNSLRSVAILIQKRRALESRVLTGPEVMAVLYDAKVAALKLPLWEARWPLFDLYTCAAGKCDAMLMERGFCERHGGSPYPSLVFEGHVQVRVGNTYVGYHRLMLGCPQGLEVRHLDKNRWNNRPSNLGLFQQVLVQHPKVHVEVQDAPEE